MIYPENLKPIIYLICGFVVCAAIGIYGFLNPRTPGRRYFSFACGAACLWLLGEIIGRSQQNFTIQYLGEIVRYLGAVNVPVWMFAFTRAYCGRPLSEKTLRYLLIVPAISFLFMVTSLWHTLFFSSMQVGQISLLVRYGTYYWFVLIPYSYALTLLSIFLVFGEIWRVPRQFRSQIFYLFFSMVVPYIINVAGFMGLFKGQGYTSFSIPIFAVLMAIGMFRHNLLSVSPIAYESVFNNVRDGVIIVNRDDIIFDINAAAAEYARIPKLEIIGSKFSDTFAEWDEMLSKSRGQDEIADEFSHTRNGKSFYYSIQSVNLVGVDNVSDGRIITLRDITLSKLYQNSLENLAFYDPLTQLANRRKFQQEAENYLQKAVRQGKEFAILYFDLDKFKVVNDSLGHEIGDELLKYVAERTMSQLRFPDFAARMSGDEFVILLHNTTRANVEKVIERIVSNIEQPFSIQNHTLIPGLSVGAAFYPDDGDTLQELMRHADQEMYRVKTRRKSNQQKTA